MFREEKSSKYLTVKNSLCLGVRLSKNSLSMDHNVGFHGAAPAGVRTIQPYTGGAGEGHGVMFTSKSADHIKWQTCRWWGVNDQQRKRFAV